jgi:ectoine hydroxylase-related dioxygenase (phytanoyl-CoA dioxygenase family)
MFDKVAGGDAQIGWHQDTFFILDPPNWDMIDISEFRFQFGHVHVRPTQMEMSEDYYQQTLIVRINVDEQTLENGAMRVLPGSYLEGPFEIQGEKAWEHQEAYIAEHESEAIDCVAGKGSVTFYYPTTLHSSGISRSPAGRHRCAAAHRMRAQSMQIPGWEWPTDWEPGYVPATPKSGFDMDPFS